MGSDREARALGAGEEFEVGGKTYILRPVVVKSLSDLERRALKSYKREFLETYRDNLDLLDNPRNLLEKKLEEVAGWDLSHMPTKTAYDTSLVPMTDELKKRITDEFALEKEDVPTRDLVFRAMLTMALDSKRITVDEVQKLGGKRPREGRVRFDQWWVTAMKEGMIAFVHCSMKVDYPDITEGEVGKWPLSKLIEASRTVERITSASLGNG